eukprot:Em0003g661a
MRVNLAAQWLKETFLGYFDDWEKEANAQPHLRKKEKNKLQLSKETLLELKITVNSFVELTQKLLSEGGCEYVLSDVFNQDPIEIFGSGDDTHSILVWVFKTKV